MQQVTMSDRARDDITNTGPILRGLTRHWLGALIVGYGVWVLTPFLAPVLMQIGATGPANAIYFFYSFFCHQLPQRSLFFFGAKTMYSVAEISAVWQLDGFLGLRQFVGTAQMGYKVAWSDRMIAFYGSLWLGLLAFAFVRTRIKSLWPPVWLFAGILPVAVDGLTHMLNDIVAGTSGTGFRDTNAWLQYLTGNIFPQWFYEGDALGSFNSDVRWITGFLFGLTTVWLVFPLIERATRTPRKERAQFRI